MEPGYHRDGETREGATGSEKDFADLLLERILDKKGTIFKEKQGIDFTGRDILSPSYRPDIILHRDTQIKQIIEYFVPCINNNQSPGNMLIYGKTGTGKTLVTRHAAAKIVENASKRGAAVPFITYINAKMYNTKYRILAKICEDIGVFVPKTGIATDAILDALKDVLKKADKPLVSIIDEVDLLVRSREKDDLLYVLTRLAEDDPAVRVSIIGISNDLRFKTFLGIRVLSSLNAQEIVFQPYQRSELVDILKQRADLAFKEDVVDEGIVGAIATIAAREDGDARKAIALLLKTGEVAEQEGAAFIDAEHLVKARDRLDLDTTESFLSTLPVQFQIVIIAISNAQTHYKCSANTGVILKIYHDLVKESEDFVSSIGLRRLLQILKDLNDQGILDLAVVSNGRGRSSVVSMNLERSIIEHVFSKNQQLKKLLNYIPKMKCLDSFLGPSNDSNDL
jgi:cell division control protein 6